MIDRLLQNVLTCFLIFTIPSDHQKLRTRRTVMVNWNCWCVLGAQGERCFQQTRCLRVNWSQSSWVPTLALLGCCLPAHPRSASGSLKVSCWATSTAIPRPPGRCCSLNSSRFQGKKTKIGSPEKRLIVLFICFPKSACWEMQTFNNGFVYKTLPSGNYLHKVQP